MKTKLVLEHGLSYFESGLNMVLKEIENKHFKLIDIKYNHECSQESRGCEHWFSALAIYDETTH